MTLNGVMVFILHGVISPSPTLSIRYGKPLPLPFISPNSVASRAHRTKEDMPELSATEM